MIWPTAWTAAPSVRLYRNFLQETHCSTKSTLNYRCPGYLAGLSGLLKFVVLSIRPEPEYDGQIWYPDIWLYKQMALFQHWPDNLLLLENVNTQLLFMKNKNYQIPVRILKMYRCKKSHFLKVKTKRIRRISGPCIILDHQFFEVAGSPTNQYPVHSWPQYSAYRY